MKPGCNTVLLGGCGSHLKSALILLLGEKKKEKWEQKKSEESEKWKVGVIRLPLLPITRLSDRSNSNVFLHSCLGWACGGGNRGRAENGIVMFEARKQHWGSVLCFCGRAKWTVCLFLLFFCLCAQGKIAETSRHYLAKSRPNICDVYWHIDFPWQLLADRVRRMGPCVQVHGRSVRSRQHYAHQENEA